jgi:sortase (surface protein transpeptidase)
MFGRTLLLAACLLAVVSPDGGLHPTAPSALPAQTALTPSGLPPATASTSPTKAINPIPSRLLIPRIGVNALIEARGLDSGRNMLTPKDFHDVAWYSLGPSPGAAGNALINGHVDWWTGSAVFTRLGELRPGDRVIVVRGDGSRLTFKVTGRQTVAAAARVASLFAPSKVATLTLITCSGAWDPLILGTHQRLLVSAVLA